MEFFRGPVSTVSLARCQPDGQQHEWFIKLFTSLLQVSRFLQHAEFLPGELLMRQGERGDHMFIILAGTCKARQWTRRRQALRMLQGVPP